MAMAAVLFLLLLCAALVAGGTARAIEALDIAMVTERKVEESLHSDHIAEVLGLGTRALQFGEFVFRHGKKYESLEELKQRFSAFVSNVELIESTNTKNLPYKLGVNKFADLTFEEFKQHFLGAEQDCSATRGNHMLTSQIPPLKKDWREDGIVSGVKNQASCGSCWTFSTTGALESAHAQATGHMVLLSEQQLVDCAGGFNNFGCNGGLPSQAFEYIKYNGGLDTEESYPYTAKDGICKYNGNSIGATVFDVVNITQGAEDELLHAVGTVRPVSVAFEVINEFQHYSSGIFTSPLCHDGPQTVNHAVLAVGYHVDEEGIPYWIVKNSWGADWGENGYFNIELGINMCGVATCASYPTVPEEFHK